MPLSPATASLTGKTALVTGSTSGIGLAIAETLASAGANLLLNGFGPAGEIEALRSRLAETYGVEVAYDGADMSDAAAIEGMVAGAKARFGGIDILVNNAGIQHVAPLEDFPADRWDAIVAINLSACFHTTRLVVADMKAKGWGRILNVASVHGLVGSIHKSAYVAAKHGVIGLTKVTALETATSGVTCNAICPGWVLTPLVQKQVDAKAAEQDLSQEEAKRQLVCERMPSERFVSQEEVGGVALFLCSPAADNMTGVSLPVDGAWLAQ
ncbi:3-hydroxybutyrate dehydrogenase [Algihabitans albus]|uniref:3-hydroxybutyrate dehydrogenase n=1 Tax=Algihabitans albus TaxID=2164067 RepID=UPI001ABC3B99|nr:3-hydroxybutyrate dehydrogenase [Algihabitans albus]